LFILISAQNVRLALFLPLWHHTFPPCTSFETWAWYYSIEVSFMLF